MTDSKKYQIFVSSTFADLQKERRLVSQQILDMGHIPIGMELFEASDLDQWSYIERRIKEADYYVLIVKERYGSKSDDGISFTEKEYRFAIEVGIPVLSFLSSDFDKDRSDAPENISQFRDLCKKKLVKFWDNPEDLALKVSSSLSRGFYETPRDGLIRASDAPPSDALERLLEARKEIDSLQERLDSVRGLSVSQDLIDAVKNTKLKDACEYAGSFSNISVEGFLKLYLLEFVGEFYEADFQKQLETALNVKKTSLQNKSQLSTFQQLSAPKPMEQTKLEPQIMINKLIGLGLVEVIERKREANTSRAGTWATRIDRLYKLTETYRSLLNEIMSPAEILERRPRRV